MLPIFWRCGFDSTAGIPPFPKRYAIQCAHSTTMYSILAVAIFWLFRLYQSVWRYASVDEVLRSVGGSMLTSALYMLARTFYFYKMPRSFHVFGTIIQLVLVVGARFSYRLLISVLWRISGKGRKREQIMIIGVGSAGQMLIQDLARARETNVRAVCLIDDSPAKQGRFFRGRAHRGRPRGDTQRGEKIPCG